MSALETPDSSSRSNHGAEPAIQIRGLDYAFGTESARKQVLFDVDLTIDRGEFVILTGPSGSGKTTLLGLIGALRRPQEEASLRVLGQAVSRLEGKDLEQYRKNLGFIFQLHNLFPALTAYQSVQMAADLSDLDPAEKRERIESLLSELGLAERMDYKPEKLSGGQRQRVAIARAIVHRPALILADEPTAALDAENTEIVLGLFRRLGADQGTTTLMVTQDTRVFESANRLVQLVDGRIVSDETLRGFVPAGRSS